jgi:hypothetical protein
MFSSVMRYHFALGVPRQLKRSIKKYMGMIPNSRGESMKIENEKNEELKATICNSIYSESGPWCLHPHRYYLGS